MLTIFICSIFLLGTIDFSHGKYQRVSHGWISQHKVATTWDKAYKQCQREGAVLASPTTKELRDKMQSLIDGDTMYFTGTRAIYDNEIFASVEGILLDDMPVTNMYEKLHPGKDQCLTMNSNKINVVQCSAELPYMCYKKQIDNVSRTDCGTYDKDYKLVKSTGSCYKVHYEGLDWHDAYITCVAEGGYLAIINDSTEANLLVNDVITRRAYYVWVGLVDWEGSNDWRSLHGQPINELHHNWETEPKGNGTANCAGINPLLDNKSGKLKFFKCDSITTYFLCERDPAYIQYQEDIYEA